MHVSHRLCRWCLSTVRYARHLCRGPRLSICGWRIRGLCCSQYAIVDEEAHLDRLERSLAELGIAAPMSRAAMKIVVRETMNRNRIRNGIVYIQVTRGVASRDHNYPAGLKPVLVVTARHTDPARRASVLRDGISVVTVPDQRWARCDIKSISLLPNVLARQTAKDKVCRKRGRVDADGMVTEGAATNAWIVDKAGVLRTRPADGGILNGIVRQTIIGLLDELDLKFEERAFSVEEAMSARVFFNGFDPRVVSGY